MLPHYCRHCRRRTAAAITVLQPPPPRCRHLCHRASNTATATALTMPLLARFRCHRATIKQQPPPPSPYFFSHLRLVLSLCRVTFCLMRNPFFLISCHRVQGLHRKKCNQTIIEPYIRADYNLEILGQKWRALTNCLALRICQNLVLGKNNQVSLTIGQILGTIAEALSKQKKKFGLEKIGLFGPLFPPKGSEKL